MEDGLRSMIFLHVIDRVEGGTHHGIMQMIDEAIDDGFITEQEFRENELEICDMIDNHIFECSGCGWTLPVSETGEDQNGELRCGDCSPLEGDEEDEA